MIKRSIIYILILLCVFLLSACKTPKQDSEEEKDGYEVKVFNSDVVSGLDEIDNFYHITNDEKKKASIIITYEYDKDYYNRIKADSEPIATENVIRQYKIDFDDNYYYYYCDCDIELIGEYKYFIYSTQTNVASESQYTFIACYILSNEADMTTELWFRLTSSAILEDCLRGLESRIALTYRFNNDLFFNKNEILSITYSKDYNEYTSYNSDITSLVSVVKVLNEAEWTKGYDNLEIDITDKDNIVMIAMKRTLVCDKNNLMLKRDNGNNEYNLFYTFNLDGKYVSMQYLAMSSGAHMLYAKLSDEHIELIKSTLREEMLEENNE